MKRVLGVVASLFVAGALTLGVSSGASAISPGETVTFSGNTISWTNAWVDHSLDSVNGNLMFLCDPADEPDANLCDFGNNKVALTARDGATSITFCSDFSGNLVLGNTYNVRIVKHIASTPTQVATGQVTPAAPCPGQSTPSPASSSPAAPIAGPNDPPAVGIALQGAVGSLVAGTPVSFTGTSMKAGSTYLITVNSNPVILAEGVIPEGGRIAGLPRLPELPPGEHTLRLTTTGWDGSSATISQVFVVGDDGRFVSISEPVGSVTAAPQTSQRLAYTGVSSSSLPVWAMWMLGLGLALVLYAARANHLITRPEFAQALRDARTPREILQTPISVPGIDYLPRQSGDGKSVLSLADAVRELDLACSKMIAEQAAKLGNSVSMREGI